MISAEIVFKTEQCNFHNTESNAITSSVVTVALSFSEVTDTVFNANCRTLSVSICLTVENVDLKYVHNFKSVKNL